MSNNESKNKKANSSSSGKAASQSKFSKEVIKFYSNLGLANLPETNNKLTMFPYEPFQTSVSAVSETN
jgi:hypothetical protein